ncbi:MAG: hypothetical protein DBX97_03490 [Collinsella tanakaei]|nr:MAG: hypothetical protein DBX97_03490 [Collinsella tanakaei]
MQIFCFFEFIFDTIRLKRAIIIIRIAEPDNKWFRCGIIQCVRIFCYYFILDIFTMSFLFFYFSFAILIDFIY